MLEGSSHLLGQPEPGLELANQPSGAGLALQLEDSTQEKEHLHDLQAKAPLENSIKIVKSLQK